MSIDRETIGRVGKAFALPGTVTEVVPVTDGLINRSFRVEYASRKGTCSRRSIPAFLPIRTA